jgi:hypothetical protein
MIGRSHLRDPRVRRARATSGSGPGDPAPEPRPVRLTMVTEPRPIPGREDGSTIGADAFPYGRAHTRPFVIRHLQDPEETVGLDSRDDLDLASAVPALVPELSPIRDGVDDPLEELMRAGAGRRRPGLPGGAAHRTPVGWPVPSSVNPGNRNPLRPDDGLEPDPGRPGERGGE